MSDISRYNEILKSDITPKLIIYVIFVILTICSLIFSIIKFKKEKVVKNFVGILLSIIFFCFITYMIGIPLVLRSYDYSTRQYDYCSGRITEIGGNKEYIIEINNQKYFVPKPVVNEQIYTNDTVKIVFGEHSKCVVSIEKININN